MLNSSFSSEKKLIQTLDVRQPGLYELLGVNKKKKKKESGCGKHSHFHLWQGKVITNAHLWTSQR